jgi:hypothetical protein
MAAGATTDPRASMRTAVRSTIAFVPLDDVAGQPPDEPPELGSWPAGLIDRPVEPGWTLFPDLEA